MNFDLFAKIVKKIAYFKLKIILNIPFEQILLLFVKMVKKYFIDFDDLKILIPLQPQLELCIKF